MNDGQVRCSHGNPAVEVPRPDLGPGYVQPIAEGCKLCAADPESVRIPYRPGDWQERAARKAAAEKETCEECGAPAVDGVCAAPEKKPMQIIFENENGASNAT